MANLFPWISIIKKQHFIILIILLLSSCSSGSTLGGMITINGQKLDFQPEDLVTLSFISLNSNSPYTASGIIRKNESYEIVSENGRLPPGKYRVCLQAVEIRPKIAGSPAMDRLRGYFDANKSKVVIDIGPGKNTQNLDFVIPGYPFTNTSNYGSDE